MVVSLVAPPAVHHHNHIAVVADLLATVHAVMIGVAAALVARGNVGLRFLLCHGCFRSVLEQTRVLKSDIKQVSLPSAACLCRDIVYHHLVVFASSLFLDLKACR